MPKRSAGLLLFRSPHGGCLQVLLVHPGGPWWTNRQVGAWSIPKGEIGAGEDPMAVAEREFAEELGSAAPSGARVDLGEVRQAGGKVVRAWGVEGDLDVSHTISNTFSMTWPPGSGQLQSFPEVDCATWFTPHQARRQLVGAQVELLERLLQHVGTSR